MSQTFLRQALPPPMLCPTCLTVVQPRWNATPRAMWTALLSLSGGILLSWLLLGWMATSILDGFLFSSIGFCLGLLVFTMIETDWSHKHTKAAYRVPICSRCKTILASSVSVSPAPERPASRPLL